jgi:hypothetical protein
MHTQPEAARRAQRGPAHITGDSSLNSPCVGVLPAASKLHMDQKVSLLDFNEAEVVPQRCHFVRPA